MNRRLAAGAIIAIIGVVLFAWASVVGEQKLADQKKQIEPARGQVSLTVLKGRV